MRQAKIPTRWTGSEIARTGRRKGIESSRTLRQTFIFRGTTLGQCRISHFLKFGKIEMNEMRFFFFFLKPLLVSKCLTNESLLFGDDGDG